MLEAVLKDRNISFYRLAKETDITASTFTAWKHGDYTPKTEKMLRITAFLGIPLEYFYQKE